MITIISGSTEFVKEGSQRIELNAQDTSITFYNEEEADPTISIGRAVAEYIEFPSLMAAPGGILLNRGVLYLTGSMSEEADISQIGFLYYAGVNPSGYYIQRSTASFSIISHKAGSGHANLLQFTGSITQAERHATMLVEGLTIGGGIGGIVTPSNNGYLSVLNAAGNGVAVYGAGIISGSIISSSGNIYAGNDIYCDSLYANSSSIHIGGVTLSDVGNGVLGTSGTIKIGTSDNDKLISEDVGLMRYRSIENRSLVEVVMQTGEETYE